MSSGGIPPSPKCPARRSIESQTFPTGETGSQKNFLSLVRAARRLRGAKQNVYGLRGCSQAGMGHLTPISRQGWRVHSGQPTVCGFAESKGEEGP